MIPYLPGDAVKILPGCDPRPEAQKGRKAHVIQMTVKEHKTGTSRVQEKRAWAFLFYGRMASFLDTAPIFDYYNAVTLLTTGPYEEGKT